MIDIKNFLLISVVLVVAGIVGVYIPYLQYQGRQNTQSAAVATSTESGALAATILYTNRGFEPDTVTIKVGSTVEWINESDGLMWVASDPHPSHTDLPGFDERGIDGTSEQTSAGIVPIASAHTGGAPYRYTFIKVGRWGYHNHLNPADRGTVIVQ